MSTNYCNANDFLPQELIQQVLSHLPPDRRERVLLYIHPDYYAARNAKLAVAVDRAVAERRYPRRGDLYAALAQEFGLSPRRICAILRRRRPDPATRRAPCGLRGRQHPQCSARVGSRDDRTPARRGFSPSVSGRRAGAEVPEA